MPVNEYLVARLDVLFGQDQTALWLELKRSCDDSEIVELRDDIFLTHLRAAHVLLFRMVLTKKYFSDDEIIFSVETGINDYLNHVDDGMIRHFVELYLPALGSSPDGVLVMARAMTGNFSSFCEPVTVLGFREIFYGAISTFRSDFKKIKLI